MIAGLLTVAYIFTCLFLICVVLIQKGEGGGLGGFAGGGAVDVAFGAKADMTWKRATATAAAVFLILTIVLGIANRPTSAALRAAREQQRKDEKERKDREAATVHSATTPGAANPNTQSTTGTGR